MAREAGATIIDDPLVGDVQTAAEKVIRTIQKRKGSIPLALAFGGETTVTLTGQGKGGRNQELALRMALIAQDAGFDFPWCFLSGGTDGRDGPTDAAGALVDSNTLVRLKAAHVDIDACLQENDSYAALKATNDLLITGATGTNVADLQLFFAA
jgi:hydroxypyruvate reductase